MNWWLEGQLLPYQPSLSMPFMWQEIKFAEEKPRKWKCEYCSSTNKSEQDVCTHCGAPEGGEK